MKYLKQFLILFLFSFVGEMLNYVVPLPVPGSIYGLVLLFMALLTGVVKVEQVRKAAKFLIEIMPLLFIPAGVGLMERWGDLQEMLIPVLVIVAVSTVLVMGVTGRVTERMMKGKEK